MDETHRWALSSISVISDIGLSLISELLISDWESGVRHYIGYRNKVLSDIWYPTSHSSQTVTVAQCYSARHYKECWFESAGRIIFFLQCQISEWALVPVSKNRNIPEVFLVRRWAVGVLGIWRGRVGWVRSGANGVSLQATWDWGGRFLSQLEGAK